MNANAPKLAEEEKLAAAYLEFSAETASMWRQTFGLQAQNRLW
jgi:hypothetical protein